MRLLHSIIIGLNTSLSVGANAPAVEMPPVCSHVASLANGHLTDVYLKGGQGRAGSTEVCADLNGDGRDECAHFPGDNEVNDAS